MLKHIYQFISTRGVKHVNPLDDQLTSALNLISILTSMGAFGIFVLTYIFTTDYVYMVINISVAFTYLVLVVFHHFIVHQPRICDF